MFKEFLNEKSGKIKILSFWPIFGTMFWCLEKFNKGRLHEVYCAWDDRIPFCEYFIIPYYFWFLFLIGMIIYGFFWDDDAFKNYMKFTIISYFTTLIIYLIYPTMQNLRPEEFVRNNIFVELAKHTYDTDTNTNVCPSIHVLGSMATYFAARKSKHFGSLTWRIIFFVIAASIILSTAFVKQHSVVDIISAIILGMIIYPIVYPCSKKSGGAEKVKRVEAGVV